MKANKLVIALLLSAHSGSANQESMIAQLQQQELLNRKAFREEHQFTAAPPIGSYMTQQGQGYANFKRYSPFYLRSHPKERVQGDIADIQMLAMQTNGQNQLEGVENVFEKNIGSFEKLITGAASSSQQKSTTPNQIAQQQQKSFQTVPEVQEKTFAQLDQAAISDQAQGEGLFLEESTGQSEIADLKHQLRHQATNQAISQEGQERMAARPPPKPIQKEMIKKFHAKSIQAVPSNILSQQPSSFEQQQPQQFVGNQPNMIPVATTIPQMQPQIVYTQPAAPQPQYFMAPQPISNMMPMQQTMQIPQAPQPVYVTGQQATPVQQPQQQNSANQQLLLEKIQQIEQKVGSVKEKIESLEKQKKELDSTSSQQQAPYSSKVQLGDESGFEYQGTPDVTMLQLDEDVEMEESKHHKKSKKHLKKKHKKKRKHHKKAKKEDPKEDTSINETYHKEHGPNGGITEITSDGANGDTSVTIEAQKKAKHIKSTPKKESNAKQKEEKVEKSSNKEEDDLEAEMKEEEEIPKKQLPKKNTKTQKVAAQAPQKVSQDQQMEDEMDIGDDLVSASGSTKPFDMGLQSENLSELEVIGFADSAALEAEAVDMDPEERQQRDLFNKQKQEEQNKRQELQKKVDEQKQILADAQKQLNDQVKKQQELEKQSKEQLKKNKRSLAQLAAKAKQRSMQKQEEEEMKFEQDMF